MLFLTHKAKGVAPRTEKLSGQDHLVIPVVAVVEGVLNGGLVLMSNLAPTLDAWEGVLVTMAHPKRNGQPISANSKYSREKYVVGTFFNVHIDEKNKSLDGEIWIDLSLLENHGDKELLLQKLEEGALIDVSTGYYAQQDEVSGEWNGVKYNHVQHTVIPNHLAILLHEPGACSVSDGCGTPRVNAQENSMKNEDGRQGFLNKLAEKMGTAFDIFKVNGFLTDNAAGFNAIQGALREKLKAQEVAEHQNVAYCWVIETFPTYVVYGREFANGDVDLQMRTYEIKDETSLDITLGESMEVVQKVEYVPKSNADDPGCSCQHNAEEATMKKNELIEKIIANGKAPFKKDQLEAMGEPELQYLANMDTAEPTKADGDEPQTEATPKADAPAAVAAASPAAPVTNGIKPEIVEMLNKLGADGVAAVTNAAAIVANAEKVEKDRLVSQLVANTACRVQESDLRTMSISSLRGLAQSFGMNVVYAGQGGAARVLHNSEENAVPAAPKIVLAPKQATA